MVAHFLGKEGVAGSIPAISTNQQYQTIRRYPRWLRTSTKVTGVVSLYTDAGSNPVRRSKQHSGCIVSLVDGRFWKPEAAGAEPAIQTKYFRELRCGRTQKVRAQVVTLLANGSVTHRSPLSFLNTSRFSKCGHCGGLKSPGTWFDPRRRHQTTGV